MRYGAVVMWCSYCNSRCGVRLRSPAWIAILFLCLCSFPASTAAQQPDEKRVLLLFAEYKQRSQFLQAFESSVQAQVKADITFEEAYLEGPQGPQSSDPRENKNYLEGFAENLRRRFAGVKLDLLVAVGPWALVCAERYHEKMLPGVPVVFSGVSEWQFAGESWKGVTGVTGHVGLGETIDLALRLEPDTETVALISPDDPPWLAATHKELSRYQKKVKEIDFIGSPGRQIFERVAALPPHSIVLFHLALQDSGQPPLAGFDLLEAIAQRVPTFSAWQNFCLNHGCIGGVYGENADMIQLTASAAVRVLSGEPVDKIPVGHVTGIRPQVDWRALQHWHIPESALPPGTQILYREPSLWEQGRKYFLSAIAVILLQSFLIFALFWQRSRRRKAEIEQRKSEEKFAKAFRESPLAITIVKISDGRYVEVNESFELQTGWSPAEVIGQTPFEIGLWTDPDHRMAFMKQLLDKGNVKDLEVQLRRKDGQIRTSLGSAELIEVNAEPCVLSVFADITERKHAEEAISGFSRRLIEAQEAERTRIARELHDDINQRLAMVAVTLKTAKQSLPIDVKAGCLLDDAGARVSELESDIQSLSHRLHSSKLEYLGLESAASSLCKELAERQNVNIDFHCHGIPEDLSSEVSLCLFRVLQEALHNAVKYSGINEFQVALNGTSHEIYLRVHDSGAGFDAKRASNGHGLGLTSMKERLKLVSGELSIYSRPQEGTTIFARVPLAQETTRDHGKPTAHTTA